LINNISWGKLSNDIHHFWKWVDRWKNYIFFNDCIDNFLKHSYYFQIKTIPISSIFVAYQCILRNIYINSKILKILKTSFTLIVFKSCTHIFESHLVVVCLPFLKYINIFIFLIIFPRYCPTILVFRCLTIWACANLRTRNLNILIWESIDLRRPHYLCLRCWSHLCPRPIRVYCVCRWFMSGNKLGYRGCRPLLISTYLKASH
jgi:hypothetical protein